MIFSVSGKALLIRRLSPQFLKIMKLTAVLLTVSFLQVYAKSFPQVSLSLKNAPVEKVFFEIERQAGYGFLYTKTMLSGLPYVTIKMKNASVNEVLNECFKGQPMAYSIENTTIVVTRKAAAADPARAADPALLRPLAEIHGRVVGSGGEPLQNVSVTVVGSQVGTTTNNEGLFILAAPDNKNIALEFSSVGYQTQRVNVGNRTEVNIVLELEISGLSDIVVVGYGTQRKSDLTGAVSSITTKDYAEQRVSRLDQILQGRATGVQVTNIDGAPGSDVKIRIRGANSALGSNNPLFVIDGFVGADFNMLNPNDIESIEILKDASATAIYGSRGSNGVILVTTKKGARGDAKVNYQGSVSSSRVINKYDVLNAGDFAQVVNEKNAAIGLGSVFTEAQIKEFYATGGVNWQDAIYQTAIANDQQLSVSGGNEKTTYMVSANYLNNEGVIKNSGFKRYMLRSNLNTRVNNNLSFRLNLTGSNTINKNTQTQNGGAVVQSLAWAPTTPMYDAVGNYTVLDPVGSLGRNPMALIYDREENIENFFANVAGGARYEFSKHLSLSVDFFLDYLNQQVKNFNGNYASNFNPSASVAASKQITLQNTNTLSYKRTFNEMHNLDIVGVFEAQRFTGNYLTATATGLKFPSLKYDNLGQAGSFNIGSSFSKWTLGSLLGRINYSFRNKYLVSASVRRDGSSKFQAANRYSVFPSIALGWNLLNEEFIKNLDVFSRLKLRASWGLTGSQAIQPYATLSPYASIVYGFSNNNITSGVWISNPGNKDLKWETTDQKNIGLEAGFLDGRLSIEADYFIKNTTDLLLNRPMPYYVGGGVFTSNVGEIENKGWELQINATIISKTNFTWTSALNISNVKNTVISLGGIADKIFTGSNTSGINFQSEFVYQPGMPLGTYWGLKYLGTWKPNEAAEAAQYGMKPGDARYEDVDNNHSIDNSDYQIIGFGLPKNSIGWNNTFTHKEFTLNFFFQGIFGVDKLNNIRGTSLRAGRDNRQATLSDIKDRYIPGVNETSDLPAFSVTNVTQPQSTMFMEDGSFVRLKNISLSYDLSKLIKGFNAAVFVNATNLLTITKYKGIDPEVSSKGSDTDLNQGIDYGAYPNSKTYKVGVNLTF